MNIWLKYGALVLASYLWGSICWGLVFSFLVKHEDIRLKDNPGLSGSVRQYGWGYGLTVGLLDMTKGYVVSLVLRSMVVPSWVLIASFMAVIVGHNWPVFFQFRGGGGVATTLGILLQGYLVAVLWALPFAAIAGVIWKLAPVSRPRYTSLRLFQQSGLSRSSSGSASTSLGTPTISSSSLLLPQSLSRAISSTPV